MKLIERTKGVVGYYWFSFLILGVAFLARRIHANIEQGDAWGFAAVGIYSGVAFFFVATWLLWDGKRS